jgi:hypothetical protein
VRSPGDASDSHRVSLSLIARPDDPRLVAFWRLMDRVFADPDSVLSVGRLQEFLASDSDARQFHVLVAESPAGAIVGGSVFSYIPRSRCGFSEYLLLEDSRRGRGLGRQLFDHRKSTLEADASPDRCRGVFIEVDNPVRTPPDLSEHSTLDPYDRLRIFAHLGFRRVDIAYVQPPLGPGKNPVDHMDLLFAPWLDPSADHIPTDWILDTLQPIWSAWSPRTAPLQLTTLLQGLAAPEVALLDPLSGLDST